MARARAVSRSVVVRTVRAPRRRSVARGGGGGLSLAVIMGLVPGMTVPLQAFSQQNWQGGMETLLANYTGYERWSGRWRPISEYTMRGLFPLLLGMLVHGIANKTGLNRRIKSWGIPLISI